MPRLAASQAAAASALQNHSRAIPAVSVCGCPRSRRPRRWGARAGELPAVDWHHRPHLQQALFIDRSDTVRARFAVGLFERISSYRGCSRAMIGWPCGLEAANGESIQWGTQAALFSLAGGWQLRPHLFTSPRQRFEPDDADRFELLVCLDSGIQTEVLKQLSAARPTAPASYVPRVCTLTDFLLYCSDEALLRRGSQALLDGQLRAQVALALPALRPSPARVAAASAAAAAADEGSTDWSTGRPRGLGGRDAPETVVPAYMLPPGVPRPPLRSEQAKSSGGGGGNEAAAGASCAVGGGDEQWERMALLTSVCCAGMVQYLLDCRPDDLLDEEDD